jgi:outer membrane murein-binding lipoprotein Lpp
MTDAPTLTTTEAGALRASGAWSAFNDVLNWINTLTEQHIDKKKLYAAVMDMRPKSLPEDVAALRVEIECLRTEVDALRAERDAAVAELERERMRLAACGVVALSDTPESAARERDMHPDYRSASCDNVARRVDECMTLRARVAELEKIVEVARRVASVNSPTSAILQQLRAALGVTDGT